MISSIVSFISVVVLVVLNWQLMSLIKKQQQLLTDVYEKNSREIIRLFLLLDMLEVQNSNPIIFSLYHKIRSAKFEDLPKNEKDQINFTREVVREFHEKLWDTLKEKISKTQDMEEKAFYENQLIRLTDVINLLSLIDDKSSTDYMKLVASEIFRVVSGTEEND